MGLFQKCKISRKKGVDKGKKIEYTNFRIKNNK